MEKPKLLSAWWFGHNLSSDLNSSSEPGALGRCGARRVCKTQGFIQSDELKLRPDVSPYHHASFSQVTGLPCIELQPSCYAESGAFKRVRAIFLTDPSGSLRCPQ
jgi:hypothetical protein